MPVTVELKYEYFLTWPGKIKLIEVVRNSCHLHLLMLFTSEILINKLSTTKLVPKTSEQFPERDFHNRSPRA